MSSCSRSHYVPNPSNAPLLSEKGESNIELNFHNGDITNGFNTKVAYALTDKVGLISNGHYSHDNDALKDVGLDIGAGYFKKIGKSFIVEGYGGFGFAVNNDLSNKHTYYNTFIQPNIGIKTKHVELGISNRLKLVKFSGVDEVKDWTNYYPDNKPYIFYEPSAFLRLGKGNVKFNIQAQHSIILRGKEFSRDISSLSLGVSFRLNKKKK